ncbi:hypothetical protein [Streptomyces luteogriseus]|uniref:hypothetical protein n=1 Tax=Streptomyces luteogriseus TaxID=68233 RepID=UPI00380D74DE
MATTPRGPFRLGTLCLLLAWLPAAVVLPPLVGLSGAEVLPAAAVAANRPGGTRNRA